MKQESREMLEVAADNIEENGDLEVARFLRMMAAWRATPDYDNDWMHLARHDLVKLSNEFHGAQDEDHNDAALSVAANDYHLDEVQFDDASFILYNESDGYWVAGWFFVYKDAVDAWARGDDT